MRACHATRLWSVAGCSRGATTALSPEDVVLEFVINALRLDAGFTRQSFVDATGLPFAVMEEPLGRAIQDELVIEQGDRLLTSARGQRYLNELLQYWMPGADTDAGHS